jgi:branched-chain amino acid transport system ATP-binding protein
MPQQIQVQHFDLYNLLESLLHLLILDEATEGLAPLVRAEIWHCLQTLKQSGLSVLVIDKNLVPLMRLADTHFILEKGQTIWHGSSYSLMDARHELKESLGV